MREAAAEEVAPELPVDCRTASARNLDRVVPIEQRQTVNEITVTLTSLELFGEGLGVLRYRISYKAGMFEGRDGFGGIPEPALVVRDGSGRELPWLPQGGGSGMSEADGEVELRDLPEAGELEVEATRLVFNREAGEEVVEESYDGPWIFPFSI